MKSKIASGSMLTLAGATGLVYGAISEIQGYTSRSLLFGVIFIGVFVFFAGIAMLRSEIDGI